MGAYVSVWSGELVRSAGLNDVNTHTDSHTDTQSVRWVSHVIPHTCSLLSLHAVNSRRKTGTGKRMTTAGWTAYRGGMERD